MTGKKTLRLKKRSRRKGNIKQGWIILPSIWNYNKERVDLAKQMSDHKKERLRIGQSCGDILSDTKSQGRAMGQAEREGAGGDECFG